MEALYCTMPTYMVLRKRAMHDIPNWTLAVVTFLILPVLTKVGHWIVKELKVNQETALRSIVASAIDLHIGELKRSLEEGQSTIRQELESNTNLTRRVADQTREDISEIRKEVTGLATHVTELAVAQVNTHKYLEEHARKDEAFQEQIIHRLDDIERNEGVK